MTPSRKTLAPPSSAEDVVAWLDAMPAIQRERVARILTDAQTVKAVGLSRARAVVELTKMPGASWASVAQALGVSEAAVNRLVTAARKATPPNG